MSFVRGMWPPRLTEAMMQHLVRGFEEQYKDIQAVRASGLEELLVLFG